MPRFIDPCLDPGFGYENKDGYVRICNIPRPQGGKLVMRHRWFWELFNGPIPEGKEINHLCKNRRCCNVNHLECIDGTEHTIKDNKERYRLIKEQGLSLLEQGVSKKEVAKIVGRSVASINYWLRGERDFKG